MPVAGQAGCTYVFLLYDCKNCNAEAVTMSSQLYVYVFTFLLIKIITRGRELVRPVVRTCFLFSAYQNSNVKAAATGLPVRSEVPIFPLKIWSAVYIWGLSSRKYKYLFSHLKCEVQYIPEACLMKIWDKEARPVIST